MQIPVKDRYVWANSADPDQTAPKLKEWSVWFYNINDSKHLTLQTQT